MGWWWASGCSFTAMSSLTPSRHGLRPSGAFEAAVRRIFLTFSLRLPSSERGETSGRGVDPRRPGRHSASLPLVTRIHRISPETASRGSGFARERGREREGGRAREGWWARTERSWPPPRARAERAPAATQRISKTSQERRASAFVRLNFLRRPAAVYSFRTGCL